MMSLEILFDTIIQFSVIAFVILGAVLFVLIFLRQPVERIRAIQIGLAGLMIALFIGSIDWTPHLEIPILPRQVADSRPKTMSLSKDSFDSEFAGGIGAIAVLPQEGVPAHEISISTSDESSSASPHFERADVSLATIAKNIVVVLFVLISFSHVIYLLAGLYFSRQVVKCARPLLGQEIKLIERNFEFPNPSTVQHVRVSNRISVPMVQGLFRPVIILPEKMMRQPVDEMTLKHGIAHEWKHIARNDLLHWQIFGALQILLWPQPFYWMLRRELRICQDQIADDFAASLTNERASYAQTLVDFSTSAPMTTIGVLTMTGSKSNLFRRVEMLLNESIRLNDKSRAAIIGLVAAAIFTLGSLVASVQLTHAANLTTHSKSDTTTNEIDKLVSKNTDSNVVEQDGVVLDALTGDPIEGAIVTVTRLNSKDWSELAVTESRTNEDGRYVFQIPPEQLEIPTLYIMFDVHHESGAYAPRHCGSYSYSMIVRNLEHGTQPWFRKLRMARGSKVSGRVVDNVGRPVVNAEIRISSRDLALERATEFRRVAYSNTNTMTSDDGTFTAVVLENGDTSVSVIPYDLCMKQTDFGQQHGNLGDIVLENGRGIQGRVVDVEGKPVEGVWVNVEQVGQDQHYEMIRSSRTDANGEFQSRPLVPGDHKLNVEMKATGAWHKKKLANFDDKPTTAMFITQNINVTGDKGQDQFHIQAVPHVWITGQCVDSGGKPRAIHSPYVLGSVQEQPLFIRQGFKSENVGEFKLMVPKGVESAQVNFTTNEHSALKVELPGQPMTTYRNFRFDSIDEDMLDIKVVRFKAPILQIELLDSDGNSVSGAKASVLYHEEIELEENGVQRLFGPTTMSEESTGIYQTSSLCPGVEFEVYLHKDGAETEHIKMEMEEGASKRVTLTLPNVEEELDE